MAEFRDFIGNDSDHSNPNFALDNDGDVRLSAVESLDVNFYQHFHMVDARLWTNYIRAKYDDNNWGQSRRTLVGDRSSFVGPQPGAKRELTRATQPSIHFFDLFYDDSIIAHLVAKTNRYAVQASFKYPKKSIGREG